MVFVLVVSLPGTLLYSVGVEPERCETEIESSLICLLSNETDRVRRRPVGSEVEPVVPRKLIACPSLAAALRFVTGHRLRADLLAPMIC